MPELGFVSSPAHLQHQNDWEPIKKTKHIQDYSYADKTQINFYKCTDMLNT